MNDTSRVPAFTQQLATQLENGNLDGHIEYLPARDAQYATPGIDLHPKVRQALAARGVQRTYSHQAEAIDAAVRGENVVVSTSTASGKSVCFHAPVLDRLLKDPKARALYLFPTKALGNDQLVGLENTLKGGDIRLDVATYDGDTPRSDRARIRRGARIIISNVDMMQASMLPQHKAWRDFLSNLAFVVVDEAHFYRGVFGSHVAMIMRRLRRILLRHGVRPQFILCSATIANAGEHAKKLTGLPFTVISSDGSPSGGRAFALMDGAAEDQDSGHMGINLQAAAYTATLMRTGIRTLTFAQNRAGVERIVQYTEEYLTGSRSGRNRRYDLERKIMPYRAGYQADYRRKVESDLRTGELMAVASTNAMELGIDIGEVDATVIAGFPGTIASSWQQAGRSGRAGEQSLSVLVLRDNVVDAFYARHPEAFFGAAHESAQVSIDNPNILRLHLACAAWELPLGREDFEIFGEQAVKETAKRMVAEGVLTVDGNGRRRYVGNSSPSYGMNIRSGESERYTLVDRDTGRNMEEISRDYALRELYPGAVYTHKGQAYRVEEFSDSRQEAHLRYLNERIYTQPEIRTEVEILEETCRVSAGRRQVRLGRVRVTAQVTGYFERDLYMRHGAGERRDSSLPPLSFETQAAWFCGREPAGRYNDQPALHAIAHVGTAALAMLAMCDRRDLGGYALPEHPQTKLDTVFIFEQDAGGVGLVDVIARDAELFCNRMADIVRSCDCEEGCPSCIDATICADEGEPPSKEGLLQYLSE